MSTDKTTAIANPVKARDCGVFRMNDLVSAGSETKKTRAATISSMRKGASGPNMVVGVR
jgi:hypothetical protein